MQPSWPHPKASNPVVTAFPLPKNRPALMGVLNRTPDSFFDGGKYMGLDHALKHAKQMVDDGADLIDIGGESTRPGSSSVSMEEELNRVIPLIEALAQELKVPISIDTSKFEVAQAAISAGAVLINDVTGGQKDFRILELAKKAKFGIVLGHIKGTPATMQNAPEYQNLAAEQLDFFAHQIEVLQAHGANANKIWIDPGIGFGKTRVHNAEILRDLTPWKQLGYPICIGVSRKSLIGKTQGLENSDRLFPSVALALWSAIQGAQMLRVHDIKQTFEALRMIESLWENI